MCSLCFLELCHIPAVAFLESCSAQLHFEQHQGQISKELIMKAVPGLKYAQRELFLQCLDMQHQLIPYGWLSAKEHSEDCILCKDLPFKQTLQILLLQQSELQKG